MMLATAPDTGWAAAQTAAIVVALVAFVGIIVGASATYRYNQMAARRERRAGAFAAAIGVVERYAEMPYRVRRRDTPEARHDLADEISEIQAQLAHHQALLQIECPEVAEKYTALVRAAKIQAGGQMQEAWTHPVLKTDAEMNLRIRYARDQIDLARNECITAMRLALPGTSRKAVSPLPTANSDPIRAAVPPQRNDQTGPATPPNEGSPIGPPSPKERDQVRAPQPHSE
jgi:hypothetical protein